MAIAAWRVWRREGTAATRKALGVFFIHLGLNLAWSCLFFGLQRVGLALFEIAILLLTIVVNTYFFWRIDRLAGALFVPYVLWAAYAMLLNASLWLFN